MSIHPHGISAHPLGLLPALSIPSRSQDLSYLPPSLSSPLDNLKLDTPKSQNPIQANRFGTASGFLRSAFQQLTHRRVEAKSPITVLLDENQTQLEELTFVTSKKPDQRGICTVDLACTNDNGLTCLAFKVRAAAFETNARFKQVNLSVRLLDPDTRDVIEPDRFEPDVTGLTPPAELTTKVSGMKYKKGIHWTLIETTDMGPGIDGGAFKLWTRGALPLSAEINIFGTYEKNGRVKHITKPGKNDYLEYRVLLKL